MSVFIYKNGHWDCLAGNRIWSSQYQEWVKVKDGDQLRFNSRWHTISTNAWTSENNCKKTSVVNHGNFQWYCAINNGKVYRYELNNGIFKVSSSYIFTTGATCLGGFNWKNGHLWFIAIIDKKLHEFSVDYPTNYNVINQSLDFEYVSGGNDDWNNTNIHKDTCTYALTNNNQLYQLYQLYDHYFITSIRTIKSSITGQQENINWTEVTGHCAIQKNGNKCIAFAIGDGRLYMLSNNKFYLLNEEVGWSSLSGWCEYTPSQSEGIDAITTHQYARAKYNNTWYKIGVNVVIPEEE